MCTYFFYHSTSYFFKYITTEVLYFFRYGDAINPWGDLITMAKAWCLTKDRGKALIGIPTTSTDMTCFNAARCYGPVQLSHLFANWRQGNNCETEKVNKL